MKTTMKLIKPLLILVLAFTTKAFAQQIAYPDIGSTKKDLGSMIISASSQFSSTQNTIIASTVKRSNGSSISVVELDTLGNELWSTHYEQGNSVDTYCYSIAVSNQGYIITGFYVDPATLKNHMYLLEIDPVGNVLWNKTYGDFSVGLKVIQTSDGNYMVGGYYSMTTLVKDNYRSARLMKVDASGNPLWDKIIEDPAVSYTGHDPRFAHIETIVEIDEDFYITGATTELYNTGNIIKPIETKQKVLSMMVDGSTGNTLWDFSFSYTRSSGAFDNTPHAGADAVYDDMSQKIYLLVNYNVGDHLLEIFEMDVNGAVTNRFSFIHDVSTNFVPEVFYANQIEIENQTISIFGYLWAFNSGTITTQDLHSPFEFSFDLSNPVANSFDLYLNNSWFQGRTTGEFNGAYHMGYGYPLCHTPDLGLLEDSRLIGYFTDHFEFFRNTPGNGGVCNLISGNMALENLTPYATLQNFSYFNAASSDNLAITKTDYAHGQLPCHANPYSGPVQSAIPSSLLNSVKSFSEITVYPNPTHNEFTLGIRNNSAITSVKIYNMAGELIQNHSSIYPSQVFNLSNEAEGVYIVEVTSGLNIEKMKVVKY